MNICDHYNYMKTKAYVESLTLFDMGFFEPSVMGGGGMRTPPNHNSYQAYYDLEHYNLLETGSFLIRKLNQPTSCLMLQFKGKNTLKLRFDSSLKKQIMCLVHYYE